MQDAIEENGKRDMKQLIEEVGGWPVLGHSLDPDFEWHKLAGEFGSLPL